AETDAAAVAGAVAEAARHSRKIGETVLDYYEPPAACLDQGGAARDRALVAVDRDHVAIGGGEDFPGIAAGAKGCVDVDTAVAHREILDDAADEHGNVTGQSASDSRTAAAARHHSRAPCGPSPAPRRPTSLLRPRTF